MKTAPPPARWRDLAAPGLAPRAALVMLGVWLNAADGLVTATIMPSVARDLGGTAYFGWALAAFLLGSILAGASAGRLSQRLGLRTAMALAVIPYAAGCVASAAAPTIGAFLIGRALQGVGAGWIAGLCFVAVDALFAKALWAQILGALAVVWGVAALLGPLVGGLFAAGGWWRGAFWAFAAQGVVFAAATLFLLPRAQAPAEAARPPERFPQKWKRVLRSQSAQVFESEPVHLDRVDRTRSGQALAWRTLAVLAVAVGAIALADIAAGTALPAALTVLGLGLLAAAGAVNARPGEGLLPRDAARLNTVAGTGYATILALEVAAAVYAVYEAAILQILWRFTPLAAGYAVAAMALGWTAASVLVSGQPERRQGALIRAGAGTIVAGLALTAATIAWRPGPAIAGGAIVGVGFGLAWPFLTARVLAALPAEDRAAGAGGIPTCQLIGAAVGAAAAGAMANLLGLAHAFTPAHAAVAAPWLFAAFVPVAALGALAALRLTRKRPADREGRRGVG